MCDSYVINVIKLNLAIIATFLYLCMECVTTGFISQLARPLHSNTKSNYSGCFCEGIFRQNKHLKMSSSKADCLPYCTLVLSNPLETE